MIMLLYIDFGLQNSDSNIVTVIVRLMMVLYTRYQRLLWILDKKLQQVYSTFDLNFSPADTMHIG